MEKKIRTKEFLDNVRARLICFLCAMVRHVQTLHTHTLKHLHSESENRIKSRSPILLVRIKSGSALCCSIFSRISLFYRSFDCVRGPRAYRCGGQMTAVHRILNTRTQTQAQPSPGHLRLPVNRYDRLFYNNSHQFVAVNGCRLVIDQRNFF